MDLFRLRQRMFAALPLVLLAGCATIGAAPSRAPIAIESAIVRDGAEAGADVAGYAAFVNRGPTASIVSAACTCARAVELHVVRREGGTVSMDTDWPLMLPAGERVEVKPGSPHHLMLVGIVRPIAVGEVVALRFTLDDGREVEADFTAVADSAIGWEARRNSSGD